MRTDSRNGALIGSCRSYLRKCSTMLQHSAAVEPGGKRIRPASSINQKSRLLALPAYPLSTVVAPADNNTVVAERSCVSINEALQPLCLANDCVIQYIPILRTLPAYTREEGWRAIFLLATKTVCTNQFYFFHHIIWFYRPANRGESPVAVNQFAGTTRI